MYTLFIDTHGENIVMILYQNTKILKKREKKEKEHSRICIPTLIDLLEEAKITIDDINQIGVVIGPGSFTGVRLGVTIAKTLAFCKKIPIKTITSIELFLPTESEYLSIPEKNGYFLGRVTGKNTIGEYQYLNKEDFSQFTKTHSVSVESKINYTNLINIINNKPDINPHQVNPFYVKKIEVEK